MEQSTCDIIMCCKGHNKLPGATGYKENDVALYLSKLCHCPVSVYQHGNLEDALRSALYDYFRTCDKPHIEVRTLMTHYVSWTPSVSDRICMMFDNVRVKENGNYVNGFTEELIKQSRINLGEETI